MGEPAAAQGGMEEAFASAPIRASLAEEETELLVRAVAFAAKGSMRIDGRTRAKNAAPFAARVGMIATVFNRLEDSRFPDTVPQILVSDRAFSPTASAEKLSEYELALTRAALDAALHGADPTNGALYFTFRPEPFAEEWEKEALTAEIDGYCFYLNKK